ncbi:MAG: copper resistance system multicopper oxidase [Planctomycetes bacterium]|nr:copper resistance system multicopper oxidase [Planctomycetota bacterium]
MTRPPRKEASQSRVSRRHFLAGLGATGALVALEGCGLTPTRRMETEPELLESADLIVERRTIQIRGRQTEAVTINGTVPGKPVRLREGEDAVLRVLNLLDVDTSLHWHGMILPPGMDGVPGVAFRGIAPGELFTYRFPVRQNGTYWYHSHSGFQEQLGAFGSLIIEPAKPDPYAFDVEHVVMLSDWTFDDPMRILARLKKSSDYYNFNKQTIAQDGLLKILENRVSWGRMRMNPTDLADVTGATYTYLMNGTAPVDNWTGIYSAGQTVRLRIVNAAAASYFDLRIPGLEMTVVQADGQNIQPVTVDELRIAIAETYDVLVTPKGGRAYTIFAEAMDRSGYASGTLAPRVGMSVGVPARRRRPLLTMKQMGMGGMAGMDMPGMSAKKPMDMPGMDKPGMNMPGMNMPGMNMPGMNMPGMNMPGMNMPGTATASEAPGWARSVEHGPDHHGAGNTRVAKSTRGRLDEPGIGLEDAPHRVLVYTDLRRLIPRETEPPVDRELELHLTGNMERYIWGFDGKKFSEASTPIPFKYGERLRLTFVNDTMMSHPIHLHGMWMELVNGAGKDQPRKHTINVKPSERVSVDIDVDARGRWAMHCHILYHMDAGMFRVVEVS